MSIARRVLRRAALVGVLAAAFTAIIVTMARQHDATPTDHSSDNCGILPWLRQRPAGWSLTASNLRELNAAQVGVPIGELDEWLAEGVSGEPEDVTQRALRCLRALHWYRSLADLISDADHVAVLLSSDSDTDLFAAVQRLRRHETTDRDLAALAALSADSRPLMRLQVARLAKIATLFCGRTETCDVIATNALVDRDVKVAAAFGSLDATDMGSRSVMDRLLTRLDDDRLLDAGHDRRLGFGAIHRTLGEHLRYFLSVAIRADDDCAFVDLARETAPTSESLRAWWTAARPGWRDGRSSAQYDLVFEGVVRLQPGARRTVRLDDGRCLVIRLLTFLDGPMTEAGPTQSYTLDVSGPMSCVASGKDPESHDHAVTDPIDSVTKGTTFAFVARTVERDELGCRRVLESVAAPTLGAEARVWIRLSTRRD